MSDYNKAVLLRDVLDTIIKEDPDVIALQETKLRSTGPIKKHKENLAEYFKGYSYVWRSSEDPARKSYAGTMFLYKDKYSPEVFHPKIDVQILWILKDELLH